MTVYIIKDSIRPTDYFLLIPKLQYVGETWLNPSEYPLREVLRNLPDRYESYDDHAAVKAFKAGRLAEQGYYLSRTLDLSNYPELFI